MINKELSQGDADSGKREKTRKVENGGESRSHNVNSVGQCRRGRRTQIHGKSLPQ